MTSKETRHAGSSPIMDGNDTISVIIAALNEESHLEATVETVLQSVRRTFFDYEILLFNDGSTDGTGCVAEKISNNHSEVRVVHHDVPRNLGGVYKEGIGMALMHYIILVNGKNDITAEALDRIFSRRRDADMIIPYTINMRDRGLLRRVLSGVFTATLNLLFGMNLRYFNHSVLHRREIITSLPLRTDSYAFQAEALIKLLRRGHSYIEIGVADRFGGGLQTKALCLRNVLGVLMFFWFTKIDLHRSGLS